MLGNLIGAGISAGASLLGGQMNRDHANAMTAIGMKFAQKNMRFQRKLAQEGVRWRVKDAKKAGIHPLYALGFQPSSYAPVSVGTNADTSMGSALASAGQDISRAVNATMTGGERESNFTKAIQNLQLTKFGLENELLASQIQKLKQGGGNPAFPDGVSATADTRGLTMFENLPGRPISTPKAETQQDNIAKEYGDEGLPQIPGQVRFVRDWMKSMGYSADAAGFARAVTDGVVWLDRNVKVFPGKFKP